ncbi:DUF460 domain-containing protein [Candidatus Woesearchaeota archaeon]|nr:DUF460 domain-containing protein [Candidatus Woesearchaeota archaeon]
MKPLAIIGLDPGATTAGAALDLNGRILTVFSAKELSLSEIISAFLKVCQPLITVSDKARAPSLVEEFSRKMGTKLVSPEEDLARQEKKELVKTYFPDNQADNQEKILQNAHEFDCLASTLFAYKKYSPRIKKINDFISGHHLEEKRNDFTILAIKEEDLPFQVIEGILTKPIGESRENKIIHQVITENKITKRDFLCLYSRLSSLADTNNSFARKITQLQKELSLLRRTNQVLSRKNSDFNQRVDSLLKFKEDRLKLQSKEIEKTQEAIAELNKKISWLYNFIEKVPRYQVLKKLDTLSLTEFESKNEILRINEGDMVLVDNPYVYSEQVVEQLVKLNATIISTVNLGKFIRGKFSTVILSPEDLVMATEYFALVKREVIKGKLSEKDIITEVIRKYQEQRKLAQ